MMFKQEIFDSDSALIEVQVEMDDDIEMPYSVTFCGEYRLFHEADLNMFIRELQRLKKIKKLKL